MVVAVVVVVSGALLGRERRGEERMLRQGREREREREMNDGWQAGRLGGRGWREGEREREGERTRRRWRELEMEEGSLRRRLRGEGEYFNDCAAKKGKSHTIRGERGIANGRAPWRAERARWFHGPPRNVSTGSPGFRLGSHGSYRWRERASRHSYERGQGMGTSWLGA